jgi:hypothetical protein
MAISDANFIGNQNDPYVNLTKLLDILNRVDLEVKFIDNKGNDRELDRASIEMYLSKYAQSTQNVAVFNKFLGIDTKLDKALKEYKSELQVMISGLTSLGQAQQTLSAPVAGMSPAGNSPGMEGSNPQSNISPNAPQTQAPSSMQDINLKNAEAQAKAKSLPTH